MKIILLLFFGFIGLLSSSSVSHFKEDQLVCSVLGCEQCSTPDKCQRCYTNLQLDESKSCICPAKTYMKWSPTSYSCVACGEKCQVCYTDELCVKCEEGLVPINGVCSHCPEGTISIKQNNIDTCKRCVAEEGCSGMRLIVYLLGFAILSIII
jgi:hypothetical protein